MAAKTSDWRPGPTVCRCCLAEGCYKDISTEYFWMGKREVYAEMLTDTLNVSIGFSKSGGPNSNSRLICEPCISRLRDASDFKRQVLECEKTFMQHLDPGSTSVQKELELALEEVKIERVKQEKPISDDEDFDDGVDFVVDNADDDDDDLDDQPLMKLATKVPKKEVDLLALLDSTKVTVKRKATASTKAKEPPVKKAKKREIVIKPSASKPSVSAPKTDKKKKELSTPCTEKGTTAMGSNARIMLQNSTMYPFKLPYSSMVCVYCDDEFNEPAQFRQHMKDSHKTYRKLTLSGRLPKVDCTELSCRICSKAFNDIQCMAKHLKNTHSLKLQLDSKLGVMPFILPNNQYACAYCKLKLPSIRILSKHMSMNHFAATTCEECGKGFANSRALKMHVESTHKKIYKCARCKQTFATSQEKVTHYNASPSCWVCLCHECNIRFRSTYLKEKHMHEVHNVSSFHTTCIDCGKVFPSKVKYHTHFRLAHTDNKFSCSVCPLTFSSKGKLNKHIITHTNEKSVICPECNKAFGTQNSLRQHMWIHKEIKRFECKLCNKQFNQKVTWMSHMKSRHPLLHSETSTSN